ncbi:hypothetical protein L210DRAFT_3652413 [Boletus edulis BED1]|uniref:Uncharacterized protein n=1 Tax=Boletus edulis BED1 TaxID=1328754 RepID=A0AAD4BGU3_BOLED|nr:hypothetical protein L210DRAFT_3652413 [Boletus edulis BED1]
MAKDKSSAKLTSNAARHNPINRPSGPQIFSQSFEDLGQTRDYTPTSSPDTPTPSTPVFTAPRNLLPDVPQLPPVPQDPTPPSKNTTPITAPLLTPTNKAPSVTPPGTPMQTALSTPLPTPMSNLSDRELLSSFLEVKEVNRRMTVNPTNVLMSKLSKYTPLPDHGFPAIHLASPGQLIEDLNSGTLQEWINVDTPKLVARVFDYDGGDPTRMNPIITTQIKKVVDEISTAYNAHDCNCGVYPPAPVNGYPLNSCPNVFLIHAISPEVKEIILNRRVWSSAHITFEARPLVERTLPSLLFNLVGLTTNNPECAREIVQQTWNDSETRHQMAVILHESDPRFKDKETFPLLEHYLGAFIESVETELLDYKSAGGVATPRFNILSESPTASVHAWSNLRQFLATLPYTTSLYGVGSASRLFHCTLCHSVSHPRGLCEFPNAPFWNGPAADNKAGTRGKGKGRKA